MPTYIVAPFPRLSLKALGSAYVGTFGVLWLFIEPAGAFGLLPQFSPGQGWATYFGLAVASGVLLVGLIRGYRWYKIHHLPCVRLTVRSAIDGASYSLQVAENMQVGEFLEKFVDILLKGPARERVKEQRRRFYPVLQVRRGDALIDVDSNRTVHEAGLRDDDECQVRGQLYEHFDAVMFSRGRDDNDKD